MDRGVTDGETHRHPTDPFADLPAPDDPFPIDGGKWSTLPGMARLGVQPIHGRVEHGHFRVDRTAVRYLEEKLTVLEAGADAYRCLDPEADRAGVTEALWRAFDLFAAEHPRFARREGAAMVLPALGLAVTRGDTPDEVGVTRLSGASSRADLAERARRRLEATSGPLRLADALALACQEDFAIVRGPEEEEVDGDRAELLHVAFPSHWDPRTKLGRDFGTIHAPVAHNQAILRARTSLVRAMIGKGPFVRYAWGIAVDGRLGFHTGTGAPRPTLGPEVLADPAEVARRTHLRVERQTTFAMADLNRGIFTIRVYVTPVEAVATDPKRRLELRDALADMDDEALAYKGLAAVRDPLVAWLAAG